VRSNFKDMSMQFLTDTQPTTIARRSLVRRLLFWFFIAGISLGVMVLVGGLFGFWSGRQENQHLRAVEAVITVQEQYLLGMQDMSSGLFDLARQRFEFVLANDPGYPGAADKLAETLRILYATATTTPLPPTSTPIPTRDLIPVEEIFRQAGVKFGQGDWDGVIDTLVTLRKVDPSYRVVEVDSLLYRTLLSRGVEKIRKDNDLEGGIYDLALAERFGPINTNAQNWRNLARYYLIGSGFWEADPGQAAYYFGMVAAAAPYLRDASGWTATERYLVSLIQYGDLLASKGDWCSAQEQYERALSIRGDGKVDAAATNAAYQCFLATVTPATATGTATITLTSTSIIESSPTPSNTPEPSLTQASTPTPTNPPVESATPTPTENQLPTPSLTDTLQPTLTPTITPTPGP
jgi:tetratricopeptide (TPR) repeat protein